MPFHHQNFSLLGTGIHHGQPKPGVEKAFANLSALGVFKKLMAQGLPIKDCGDLAGQLDKRDPYGTLYQETQKLLARDTTPILIGGDHSQAFATISALLKFYPDLKVLWIDAHGDINTPETSPSGNLHGMPLAGLLGVVDKSHFKMPWLQQDLRPENVALIGIRDLDRGELALIRELQVINYPMVKIRSLGINRVLHEIAAAWGPDHPVHLSFDIDGLDSSLVPATGTPVNNGLNSDDLRTLIGQIRQQFNLVSCEIVEFNPDLAINAAALQTTENTVSEIIRLLLSRPAPE